MTTASKCWRSIKKKPDKDHLFERKYKEWIHKKNITIALDFDNKLWVIKNFDYRDKNTNTIKTNKRRYEGNFAMIKGCSLIKQGDQVVAIIYPYIKGTHIPDRSTQFYSLSQKIQNTHNSTIKEIYGKKKEAEGLTHIPSFEKQAEEEALKVHGDLRLRNILFDEDNATIIDHDYGAQTNYCDGFNHKLDDTVRHEGAYRGQLMRKEHDWASFAGMMKMFEPSRELDKAAWNKTQDKFAELAEFQNLGKNVKRTTTKRKQSERKNVQSAISMIKKLNVRLQMTSDTLKTNFGKANKPVSNRKQKENENGHQSKENDQNRENQQNKESQSMDQIMRDSKKGSGSPNKLTNLQENNTSHKKIVI